MVKDIPNIVVVLFNSRVQCRFADCTSDEVNVQEKEYKQPTTQIRLQQRHDILHLRIHRSAFIYFRYRIEHGKLCRQLSFIVSGHDFGSVETTHKRGGVKRRREAYGLVVFDSESCSKIVYRRENSFETRRPLVVAGITGATAGTGGCSGTDASRETSACENQHRKALVPRRTDLDLLLDLLVLPRLILDCLCKLEDASWPRFLSARCILDDESVQGLLVPFALYAQNRVRLLGLHDGRKQREAEHVHFLLYFCPHHGTQRAAIFESTSLA